MPRLLPLLTSPIFLLTFQAQAANHLANHLVISELGWDTNTEAVTANSSEYVEIFNPTAQAVTLNAGGVPGTASSPSYYLSDSPTEYYKVPAAKPTLSAKSLFVIQFPVGAVIPPGGVVVACNDGAAFLTEFFAGDINKFRNLPGAPQLFELQGTSVDVPDLILSASYSVSAGKASLNFTNGGDMAILYYWDGASDLIQDVDAVVYGSPSAGPNKSGASVDGPDSGTTATAFLAETSTTSGNYASSSTPGSNLYALTRRSIQEHLEAEPGGNGVNGHNEVGEVWSVATATANSSWLYEKHSPGRMLVRLDGSLSDALSFLKPLAVSAADGPGTGVPADYGQDGTLTELYATSTDNTYDGVAESLYLAVRGDLFGAANTSVTNATFIFFDLDPGSGTGLTTLAGVGNQATDDSGVLDQRLTRAGITLTGSGISGVGFDGAVGIDVPSPASGDTAGWRTFGTAGTSGTSGAFLPVGSNLDIKFDAALSSLYPGATGTVFAGPDGFEALISYGSLSTTLPTYIQLGAVTTADNSGDPATYGVSPNTLPENSSNAFTFPQVFERLVCLRVATGQAVSYYEDLDGDGVGSSVTSSYCGAPKTGVASTSGDCDDTRATVKPGLTEVCDGLDNNCNSQTDEGVLNTYYLDEDGDGYGDEAQMQTACSAPVDYVDVAQDCDDTLDTVNPGEVEVCDGLDNDCSTDIDDGLIFSDYYLDTDGDGYGSGTPVNACAKPSGYSAEGGDCSETAPELNPGVAEVCDGIDNNCNSQIDDGVILTFYADVDGDTYGNPDSSTQACTAPSGYVTSNADCNDLASNTYPGALEQCDGKDNDCDGALTTAETDGDGDTFTSCSIAGAPTDCDDTNPAINPNATEVCDNVDNNCRAGIDEGVTTSYYLDFDGDTFGSSSQVIQSCTPVAGYVINSSDCNDQAAAINPQSQEVCNSLDDDCDGLVDDADSSVVGQAVWYMDNDSDSFGGTVKVLSCDQNAGVVANSDDCNDNAPTINPAAAEVCDSLDNNCNTAVDEGLPPAIAWQDSDGDGYGNANMMATTCYIPDGYSSNPTDCDDSSAAINPKADEACDQVDNNCNGDIDEGVQLEYFQDSDGDGFGIDSDIVLACSRPSGYASTPGDCDDSSPAINPDVKEVCNGLDDDCNPITDELVDGDGDGYTLCTFDCDDAANTANPDGQEVCDGLDNDCNPDTDEYDDLDNDGFSLCTDDCDDSKPELSPAAEELCNTIDDNCNQLVDEGYIHDEDKDGSESFACGGADCNDQSGSVAPGLEEVCTDGLDNNCDAVTDGEDPLCPAEPTPTATPGQPTPTATPGQPTPTATPGQPTPTATPAEPTPTVTPGDPTPTPQEQTPTPHEPTPEETDTPTASPATPSVAPTDEPTETPPTDTPTPDPGGCSCSSAEEQPLPAGALAGVILGVLALRRRRTASRR